MPYVVGGGTQKGGGIFTGWNTACRTCTVLMAEWKMCSNIWSFGGRSWHEDEACEVWIFGWYETPEPCASKANGVHTNQKSNSPQQSWSQAWLSLVWCCMTLLFSAPDFPLCLPFQLLKPVCHLHNNWPPLLFHLLTKFLGRENQNNKSDCLLGGLPCVSMFYVLHPLSAFMQRLSYIFACNVVDCDSGFLDAVVMQVMSRQAYGLKLKRFVCSKVICLVTYSNRYFFLIV